MTLGPMRMFGKGLAATLACVFSCLVVADWMLSVGYGEQDASVFGAAIGVLVGGGFAWVFHHRARMAQRQ